MILDLYSRLGVIDELHLPDHGPLKEPDIRLVADLEYTLHLGQPLACPQHGIGQMDQYHRKVIDLIDKALTNAHH